MRGVGQSAAQQRGLTRRHETKPMSSEMLLLPSHLCRCLCFLRGEQPPPPASSRGSGGVVKGSDSAGEHGDRGMTRRRGRFPRRVYMHHLLASQDPEALSGPDAADGASTAHASSSSTCLFISQAQNRAASWLCNRVIQSRAALYSRQPVCVYIYIYI